MSSAAPGRFGTLFRWLGLTLVVLLLLQLIAVLAVNGWGEESFRQLVSSALVTQSPMAFVGLSLMLISARLEEPQARRTPLHWLVAVISGVLALSLLVTIPVAISGDRAVSDEADQALNSQKGQLRMARAQMQAPEVVDQVIGQLEQGGQIPANATDDQKRQAARSIMDRQLQQAESQLKQAEQRRDLAANQRRIGGIGAGVVLMLAFALLALVAVL